MLGTWNLSELYSGPNDPAIERDMQHAEERVAAFAAEWKGRTDYLEDPTVLRAALDAYDTLGRDVGTGDKPSYYVTLARGINQGDTELKALQSSLRKRAVAMSNSLQFFELTIGKIEESMQRKMLASTELAPHHVWLKRRFAVASHDLSDEVQAVVNDLLPLASESWVSMVTEKLSGAKAQLILDGTPTSVPFNKLTTYLVGNDNELAKQANQAHVRIARRYAGIAEHELNTVIKAKTRMSQLRGYARVDDASFERNHLTHEVIESMLETVESRYDISHRVYELRARLMSRDVLDYHERVLSYGSLPNDYTFDQAVTLLREVLEGLHPNFATEFDRALADGHIDYVARSGKRGGAACWRSLISLPTYLLLSFAGSLRDVQVLGHEFGHYLNNLYMQSGGRCNSMTFGAPTPLAEVASTFFEEYVLDAIVRNSDDETRLAILVSSLDGNVASIYRQAAATRFEQELYRKIDQKGYLSKRQIGQLFTQHMAAYMGPCVNLDAGADVGWVHWTHFRLGFYNYSYTFAQLVSIALQGKVDADPAYISEFQRMLETGSSLPTPDLLRSLGLDIEDGSVWNAGLDKMERQLHEATELATKLGKI